MKYQVHLSAFAIEDLIELHQWVSHGAGPQTATGYIDRIEARIASLSQYPDRGTPRDDLADGLRTLAFERRLVIAYKVARDRVTVLRIINAVRDLALQFSD